MADIGVVGATGAVGTVELELLAERGYEDVRAFASRALRGQRASPTETASSRWSSPRRSRSRGSTSVCFSVGTAASAELVPAAVENGAVCIDKSSAFRLADGVPARRPGGERRAARTSTDGIVANPNCSTIQLVCVLEPLRRAAGLRSVRLATYQSASGAGDASMKRLLRHRARRPERDDGLAPRGRGVRGGGQAARRDAQDPRAAGPALHGELRARPRPGRPLPGDLGGDGGAAARSRTRATCCRGRPACASPKPRPLRARQSAATRCSSAASAAIRPPRTASSSSPRATTCARARR